MWRDKKTLLEDKVQEDLASADVPKVLDCTSMGVRSAAMVLQPICQEAVEKAVLAYLQMNWVQKSTLSFTGIFCGWCCPTLLWWMKQKWPESKHPCLHKCMFWCYAMSLHLGD